MFGYGSGAVNSPYTTQAGLGMAALGPTMYQYGAPVDTRALSGLGYGFMGTGTTGSALNAYQTQMMMGGMQYGANHNWQTQTVDYAGGINGHFAGYVGSMMGHPYSYNWNNLTPNDEE